MNRLYCSLLILALSVGLGLTARAQTTVTSAEGVRIALSGGIQVRATGGRSEVGDEIVNRIGVGVRRARFRATMRFGPSGGMYMQADGASGTLSILDFHAFYDLSPKLTVRAGRLVSAQPRGFVLTGMNAFDIADRAAVAERWGAGTIGSDGRDIGIDLRYRTSQIDVLLLLGNGDGNWSRDRGNYREGISGGSATRGIEKTNLSITSAVSLRPRGLRGLELGGFAGYNPSANPNTELDGTARRYITYGSHVYYGAEPGSQRARLKVDLIGISYEALPRENAQLWGGVSLFGAVSPHKGTELFVRAEALERDLNGDEDADGYFTAGFSVSPSALRGEAYSRERITVAWNHYTAGTRGATPEDLLMIQLQLAF